MKTYRICKYNPQYRMNGLYFKDDWTDYSDIGKVFNKKVLSEQEYLTVEQHYIQCIVSIVAATRTHIFTICDLENYETTKWKNKQQISIEDLEELCRDCLRNSCWCRIQGDGLYVHFGYDYYVYVGADLPDETIEYFCKKNNLFCNQQKSPYV